MRLFQWFSNTVKVCYTFSWRWKEPSLFRFFSGRKTRQSMSSLNADLQKLLQMLLFSLWWCTMFFSLLQKTRNKSEVDFRESNLMRRNFWCSSVHFSGFWNFSSLLSLKADKYERECTRCFKITEKSLI